MFGLLMFGLFPFLKTPPARLTDGVRIQGKAGGFVYGHHSLSRRSNPP